MMENMHIVPKNHDVELAVGFTSRYSVLFFFFLFFFLERGALTITGSSSLYLLVDQKHLPIQF